MTIEFIHVCLQSKTIDIIADWADELQLSGSISKDSLSVLYLNGDYVTFG